MPAYKVDVTNFQVTTCTPEGQAQAETVIMLDDNGNGWVRLNAKNEPIAKKAAQQHVDVVRQHF